MQSFTVVGELTDLNTYINIERANKFAAAKLKKAETYRVANDIRYARVKKVKSMQEIIISWYCKNGRKDTDNIEFAKKFIMDGLVTANVIPDDSRKYTGNMTTIHHHFIDSKNPRVEVDFG